MKFIWTIGKGLSSGIITVLSFLNKVVSRLIQILNLQVEDISPLLMASTLVFSVLFLAFEDSGEVGFLFDSTVLTKMNYVYYLVEHINALIVAICFLLPGRYVFCLTAYVLIQFTDTIDYIFTYGNLWWINGKAFPWNAIKILFFGTIFVFEKYAYKR